MRRSRFPQPQVSETTAMAQLKRELESSTDERLAKLTVADLQPRYRLDRREIECVLLASQDSRRRFLAKRVIGA